MFIKSLLAACALPVLLWGPATALAQPTGGLFAVDAVTSTYTGPCDLVAGLSGWYGLRACGSVAAAHGISVVDLRRASDNATSDFSVLPSGDLNVTAAAAFAGTDAVCTGTISTTTLSISACASGTLHANDEITGAGITQPAYVTAIGTCAAPPGTCTLNASQTVAVGETITAQVALFAQKLYNQSSGTATTLNQVTTAAQPQLLFNCIGALPCLQSIGTSSNLLSTSNFTPATGVVSFSAVVAQLNHSQIMGFVRENGFNNRVSASLTVDKLALNGGTSGSISPTATNGTVHSTQWVLNGASSVANIDGTETTGTATGNTTAAQIGLMVGPGSTGNTFTMTEGGFWDNLAISSGNRTSLCNNQRLYWGTPGSC